MGSLSLMAERQHIIITGATSGLGREMALQLAARGNVHIHAVGRRTKRLDTLKIDVIAKDAEMTAHTLDVTDTEAVAKFISKFERLDGLILNAGVTFADAFTSGDIATDEAVIETNVTANLRLIRDLLPALKSAQGCILFVASLGGLTPVPYQAVYAGSKAFIINFGLSLREELKADGVKVSVFAPGGIKTEMTDIDAMSHLDNKLVPVATVATQALQAYDKMPAITVPGAENKLVAMAGRLLPRGFLAAQAAKLYRPKN